jgi:hypothetical protein
VYQYLALQLQWVRYSTLQSPLWMEVPHHQSELC